jgi:hypothetical protein
MALPIETARLEALRKLARERYGEITPGEDAVLLRSVSFEEDPPKPKVKSGVNANFLRWLATDEDAGPHIDPLGIRVKDASILGTLNLSLSRISAPLMFNGCTFHGGFELNSAEVTALYLFDCESKAGIRADGLTTSGDIFLRDLRSSAEISLIGAQVGGDLDCGGAKLSATGHALSADRARITGGVFLNENFSSSGEIEFIGAQIGGSLECDGAKLSATGIALHADGARITGSVFLRNGFSSSGAIRFVGAQIESELDCDDAKEIAELDCTTARIAGDLTWYGDPSRTILTLSACTVTTLHDERVRRPNEGKGNLHLRDFVYRDLIFHEGPDHHPVPGSARDRIDWIMRQPDEETTNAQPWMQLANWLEVNGDPKGAKQVRYAYHRLQARAGGFLNRVVSLPLDLLEENPFKIAPAIAGLWIVGSLIFWRAQRMRAMAPTDKDAYRQFEDDEPLRGGHPLFSPIVYTLENVLPVVKLGQDSAWAPDNRMPAGTWLPERAARLRAFAARWRFTRWLIRLDYQRLALLRWTLIVLGWVLALILAAAIGARFKESP